MTTTSKPAWIPRNPVSKSLQPNCRGHQIRSFSPGLYPTETAFALHSFKINYVKGMINIFARAFRMPKKIISTLRNCFICLSENKSICNFGVL